MAKGADESMTTPKSNVGDDGTAAIRGDIERTRGDMSRTVNEIEERLSPSRIKEQLSNVTAGVVGDLEGKVAELKGSIIDGYHEAKVQLKDDIGRELVGARNMVSDEITHARTAVREATVGRVEHMVHDARESVTDAGSSVISTIKANPIPAALIGVGLGWLLFGPRNGGGASASRSFARPRQAANYLLEGAQGAVHDVGETVSHFAHDAGHRVADVAGGARDAAVELAGGARDRGGRVLSGAGRHVMRAERGVESTMRENPLALGAVAIAIGAAIGLSLPHTQTEDEWMGAAKERLLHQAEEVAGEAIHKAEAAVGQLTSGDESAQKAKAPTSSRALTNGNGNGNGGAGKSSLA